MEPREIARCQLCFCSLHENQRLVLDQRRPYCSLDCWERAQHRIVPLHPRAQMPARVGIGMALVLALLIAAPVRAASDKALARMAARDQERQRACLQSAWQNWYWSQITHRPPVPVRPLALPPRPPISYVNHDGHPRYDAGGWDPRDRPPITLPYARTFRRLR